MSLFPLFVSSITNAAPSSGILPLMKEIARDPKTGQTIWKNGRPVIVSGAEAVTSWAIAALYSKRGTSKCNSKRYGNEFHKLVGSAFDEDVKTAILPNVVKDTLLQCPYITDVEIIDSALRGCCVECDIHIKTIYGEVRMYVNDG